MEHDVPEKEPPAPKQKDKTTLLAGVSPALRWGLLACILVCVVAAGLQLALLLCSFGAVPVLVYGLLYAAICAAAAVLAALVFLLIKKLRWQTVLVVTFSLLLTVVLLLADVYIAPMALLLLVGVYFLYRSLRGQYKPLHLAKRLLRYAAAGLCLLLAAAILGLLLWPGPALAAEDRPAQATLVLPDAQNVQAADAPLPEDPSVPGAYAFTTLYYASEDQKIDPYPGQERLAAPTVDASLLLNGWSALRTRHYGFSPADLPLNAQVWLPEGEGPFPLVLMVHGNHEAGERSDGGYAYLGALLASRGIIAASVDENFFNSSSYYDYLTLAGLRGENDARAYMLLEHLRAWYRWNRQAHSPFYGKVDFEYIGLIGHSRGGEAVAIAASFAQLPRYPDNGALVFHYPFRVRSVVALAPVDRQYDPADQKLILEDVNYLVLHGAYDMDVTSFMGADQYHRTTPPAGGMKAQVYIEYANHGQFNSTWGAADSAGLSNLAYNRRLLMPMNEQQQAAKVYVSAFLEATFRGAAGYETLFSQFAGGAEWLPAARYATDYFAGDMALLADFEDGYDLTKALAPGVSFSATGFSGWTQGALPAKYGSGGGRGNRVLKLSWGKGKKAPVFTTGFAPGVLQAGDVMYVSLCAGAQSDADLPVAFEMRLTDAGGHTATLPVSAFGGVAAPITAPVYKPPFSFFSPSSEPVLQMVCIDTGRFAGLQGEVVKMEWVFTVQQRGDTPVTQTLYVDDLRVQG